MLLSSHQRYQSFYNLPNHCHQLRTKSSNTEAHGGVFILKSFRWNLTIALTVFPLLWKMVHIILYVCFEDFPFFTYLISDWMTFIYFFGYLHNADLIIYQMYTCPFCGLCFPSADYLLCIFLFQISIRRSIIPWCL